MNRKDEYEEREDIHAALNNLFLYTTLERWGTVQRLLRSRNYQDAYKLARTLLARAEEVGAAHSSHYQLAGRAASDTASSPETEAVLRTAAREDAEQWFEEALALAPNSSLPAYAEALALTHYASFLTSVRTKPIRPLLKRARECVQRNESHEPWRGLNGKPFVWAGDREESHEGALPYYEAGAEVAPDWFEGWPMALAAAKLSGNQAAVRRLQRALMDALERRAPEGLTAMGLLRQRLNSTEYRWARGKRKRAHIERRRVVGLELLNALLESESRRQRSDPFRRSRRESRYGRQRRRDHQ